MKFVPFWDEGLSDRERARRVSLLFDSLERKLVTTTSGPINGSAERTYVLMPDPSPFDLDELAGGADIRRISSGVAGRAAATEVVQAAKAITPDIMDLGHFLYIFAFAARMPDDWTLGRWIEEGLGVEEVKTDSLFLRVLTRLGLFKQAVPEDDAEPDDETEVLPAPHHVLMVFDCGDLVDEESTDS